MTGAKTQKEWQKLIDALPPLPEGQYIVTLNKEHGDLLNDCLARMRLAADRIRAQHHWNCALYGERGRCDCGMETDLMEILGHSEYSPYGN